MRQIAVIVLFAFVAYASALSYTGVQNHRHGSTQSVSASGCGADGTSVTFTLGSSHCSATSSGGSASCNLAVNANLGPQTLSVTAGSSSTSANVVVYSFPRGGGAFVVGDQSVASSNVVFWGKTWRASNSFSGGISGNGEFHGFVDDDKTVTANNFCALKWTHGNGDPDCHDWRALPSHMGVIVVSSISYSHGKFTGDIVGVVVVQPTANHYTRRHDAIGDGTVVGSVAPYYHTSERTPKCLPCGTCGSNQFQSAACTQVAATVCHNCDTSCATCNGAGPNHCTACADPTTVLVQGSCVACSVAFSNCASCLNGACTGCASGFTLSGSGSTATCVASQVTCPDGQFFDETQTPPQCVACSQCPVNSYVNAICHGSTNTDCQPCEGSCFSCVGPNANQCTSCKVETVFPPEGGSFAEYFYAVDGGNVAVGGLCEPCVTDTDCTALGLSLVTPCESTASYSQPDPNVPAVLVVTNTQGVCGKASAAIESFDMTSTTAVKTVVPIVLVPVGLAIIAAAWWLCFRPRKAPKQQKRGSATKPLRAKEDGTTHGAKEEGLASPTQVAVSINA